MITVLYKIAAFLFSCILTVGYAFFPAYVSEDNFINYVKAVESVAEYENTIETAIPQTEVYNIISEHFNSALPKGKTQKKAIVIGYDGGRADALSMSRDLEKSGIMYLADNGGTVILSYCGAVNYPLINLQKTSTAPGWCSMLTGKWASETGIKDNSISKSMQYPTLLTSLIEDGKAASTAFYVSWNGHFVDEDSTYINDKNYIAEKGLNAVFADADDDEGTLANVMADIQKADCSDFIFSIFEYPDHYGHGDNFYIGNESYKQAFTDNEATAYDIIKAIEGRETYETEDWLIILTSDHGGMLDGHGNASIQERMTFLVLNK